MVVAVVGLNTDEAMVVVEGMGIVAMALAAVAGAGRLEDCPATRDDDEEKPSHSVRQCIGWGCGAWSATNIPGSVRNSL